MVSEQAKRGLDAIFTKAARAHLVLDEADSIEIEQLPGAPGVDTPGRKIVVLTISSYLFRLLTIFHVDPDRGTQAYYKGGEAGRACHEIFGERGNLCVGAMNRELGNHFPHTGMSTPAVLEGKCIGFLDALRPAYVSRHRIGINAAVSLHATLCLCAYAPIDFRVDATAALEEATGGLELF